MATQKKKPLRHKNIGTLAEKREWYIKGQERLRQASEKARAQHRNPPRVWVYDPFESFCANKEKVPEAVKRHVRKEADTLIETRLKPANIKPPRKNSRSNYLVDIFTKWHGPFFTFYAKYASPGPNALSPFFETPFARLQYGPDAGFNLAFRRYTGEWIDFLQMISLKQCLAEIRDGGHFIP